jgi:DNA-binding LacI/PurR family transcriptional regulator
LSVTIKDIAKVGGVSHTTVSRALRGHPAISEETTGRIRQIADELGYVPNTVARGLKTNRSGALGVIVRRIVDPYFSEVLSGIEDTLYAEGYSLFLAASNRDPDREEAIVRAMSERRVDGVIICSTQVGAAHRQQLERFGVPTVLINNQADEDITHSVYHDDAFGSSQLTEHLMKLGHTRIAYLGNKRGGRTTSERRHGYEQALLNGGLPVRPELIVDGPNGLAEGGASGAQQLLSLEEKPTGIICYNDVMAIGAIQALQEAGLRIPSDCSVTGFDNIELAAFTSPALTTFDQPKYEIGRQAALMMLRLLDKRGDETREPSSDILTLRGQLVLRNSTAQIIGEVRSATN